MQKSYRKAYLNSLLKNWMSTLWKLPVNHMFMVASAMTRHFTRKGHSYIGGIARMDFGEVKRRMRREMGNQSDIQAAYYWQTAQGIDPSPVLYQEYDTTSIKVCEPWVNASLELKEADAKIYLDKRDTLEKIPRINIDLV
jgi:nucleotidyltransferase/DNA polymerase involved in DNA repair